MTEKLEFSTWQEQEVSVLHSIQTSSEITQPPMQWIQVAMSPGGKTAGPRSIQRWIDISLPVHGIIIN
jgi:hypothetical protein